MDFNLFKNLDKAFDDLEKTVTDKVQQAALSVVEPEFPDRNRPNLHKPVFVQLKGKSRNVLNQWQELELEQRKAEWEDQLAELKKHQEDTQAKPQWQQRAQDAEYQLMQLLSVLTALSDPVPHMQASAALPQRIAELEAANKSLQADAKRVTEDTAEVQQLVDKFHKLEAEHKELQEQLAAKDGEMERLQQEAGGVTALQQQLDEQASETQRLQATLKALRADYESSQSQLFELSSKQEAAQGSSQVDAELLAEQLERAQQAARDLQTDRQQLVAQLEALTREEGEEGEGGAGEGGRGGWRRLGGAGAELVYEQQLAVKEQEAAALRRQLDQLRNRLQDSGREQQLELDSARSRLVAAAAEAEGLQRELARRAEPHVVEELRRQVASLQSLLDVQLEQEGWEPGQAAAMLKAQGAPPVLQERNRRLAAELQTLKQQLAEQQGKALGVQQQVGQLEAQLARQQQLVKQLEEDLATSSTGTGPGAAVTAEALAAAAVGALHPGSASPTAALSRSVSGMPGSPSSALAHQSSGGLGGGQQGGLLDIVVSQRDRFRARLSQVEEEKGGLEAQLQEAQRKLEACRADNIKLYEKIRYLEGFSGRGAGGGAGQGGGAGVLKVDEAGVSTEPSAAKANRYRCGPLALEIGNSTSAATASAAAGGSMRNRSKSSARFACFDVDDAVDEETSGGPEARWGKAYEARINPFAEFQNSERQAGVQNLQLHDRAVLASSKVLMGSKVARVFVVSYAVLLHLFIMLLLYYSAMPAAMPAGSSSTYSGGAAAGRVQQVGVAAGSSSSSSGVAASGTAASLRRLLRLG